MNIEQSYGDLYFSKAAENYAEELVQSVILKKYKKIPTP